MEINLFDFDETVYYGDSAKDFILYSYECKYVSFFGMIKIIWYYFMYIVGVYDSTTFKEKIYTSFLPKINDIDSFVLDFWKEHKCNLKNYYLMRDRSNDIIDSASPYFLLKPICDELKVKDLIASDVDKNTGKYYKKNNGGEEKVKNLYKKYPDVKVIEAYSDSIDDKPILDIAQKAFMVDDDDIFDYNEYKPSLKRIVWDFYRSHLEVLNYLVVGGMTTVLSIITYIICAKLFCLSLILSNVISWVIAVLFAYFANRIFVFNIKVIDKFKEFISFIGSRVVTLILDTLLMLLLVDVLFLNDIFAKVIVQVVIIVANYLLSKLFVFKKE